jgi:hypothetical protein
MFALLILFAFVGGGIRLLFHIGRYRRRPFKNMNFD